MIARVGYKTRVVRLRRTVCAVVMAALSRETVARADPPQGRAHPTLVWAIPQLVPSPVVIVAERVTFGMQWQITPLLYAWDVRREVDPWRALVVEPMVRQGGSIELHVGPEYLPRDDRQSAWAWRTGLRVYVPLVQHGDNLSFSMGVSHLYQGGEQSVWFSLGTQILYGGLGLEGSYSPDRAGLGTFIFALKIRYF